jgi:signal transduction histidine kinase/CheY-like chemotaxis protein
LALAAPCVLVLLIAWQDRSAVLREGEQLASRTVTALTEHALKVLETHALVLRHVDSKIRGRSWDDISADSGLQQELTVLADTYPQVQSIRLVDAQGRLRQASLGNMASGVSVAERDYFAVHRDAAAGGLFVSAPFEARISRTYQFAVSMPRSSAHDGFDGVVVVAVAIGYFTSFWQQFAPSVAYVIPLMRADGTMLVRYPAAKPQKLAPGAPFMRQIAARPAGGFYVAKSAVDGIERMNAFSRIGSHPLYVSFSIETAALLAPWRKRLLLYGSLGVLVSLSLVALVLVAMRQARHQRLATERWQEAAERHEAEIGRRERAEAELLQAQKMEAIGQLTGGVAHDFNNLLHAMALNLQLAERTTGQGPAARFHQNIRHGIDRASQLTQRLTAFSRRQQLDPHAYRPAELVRHMADLLQSTLGGTIEVKVDMAEDVWPMFADLNQTELALLNLAVNARDAMPGGGRLTISARNVSLARARDALPGGDYVEFEVSDTGTGMPQKVIERVFEPFYTTKEVGKGSGLGLSMVHGFAKQSGGSVTIESQVGRGTSVRLSLPRATGEAQAIEPSRPVATHLSGQGGRILLAEDDGLVRKSMVLSLRAAGYTVEEAANGVDALGVLDRTPVDLLVTDYAMPGMSGTELTQSARRLQPGLPVILITGFAQPAINATHPQQKADAVLHKPFQPQELTERVEILLRREPNAAASALVR